MNDFAVFAGGCFWCTEAVFADVIGVVAVVPGYTGGHIEQPTYAAVCNGTTGHAEAVRITFNPAQITYKELVEIFFATHNPTTRDRQGHDVGTQYRSAIFVASEEQKNIVEEVIAELNEQKIFSDPIVTTIEPLNIFYEAEEYHREYYAKNPEAGYCQAVISPKVNAFRKKFAHKLKSGS